MQVREKNNRKNEIERRESKCCAILSRSVSLTISLLSASSFYDCAKRFGKSSSWRQKVPDSFTSFTRNERVSDCRERNDIRDKSVGFNVEAEHISTASRGAVKLATYFSNVSRTRLYFTNSQRLRLLFRFKLWVSRNLSV